MNTQQIGSASQIQDFFFEAALATYASGEKANTNPNDGSKFYAFQRRDYLYLDRFMVNGEYSGGQTVISFQAKPVWLMQYQGWCKDDDPKVLTFLKEALCTTYEERIFHGGRGSLTFPFFGGVRTVTHDDYLRYYNNAGNILPCAFDKFSGEERIYRSHEKGATDGWKEVFWHRYQGMLLIPAEAEQ